MELCTVSRHNISMELSMELCTVSRHNISTELSMELCTVSRHNISMELYKSHDITLVWNYTSLTT